MVFNIDSPIFKNRTVFSKKYIPPQILHRNEQIQQVSDRLKWALMGSKPKDHIIYGYGGTGKTMISRYVIEELCKRTPDVKYFYINLKEANTEVRALNAVLDKIANKTARTSSSHDLFDRIFTYIETIQQKHIIFILDEIDRVKHGYDGLLYGLLRSNEVSNTSKEITVVATTNDFNFPKQLDIGTRSSFSCMDKLIFPVYNANQLKDIITQRAKEGLNDGVYSDTILSLCAAYGASEHADARKTIELLEKAAEIAMIQKSTIITEAHVRAAREQNEFEGVYSGIITLPLHVKAVALAIIKDAKKRKNNQNGDSTSTTSTVYTEYTEICSRKSMERLTQRRVTDIITELSYLGLINCTITFNEPHRGKKKVVQLIVDPNRIEQIITSDPGFEMFKPTTVQQQLLL